MQAMKYKTWMSVAPQKGLITTLKMCNSFFLFKIDTKANEKINH